MEDRRRARCSWKRPGAKGISEPDRTRAAAPPSNEEETAPTVLHPGLEGRECKANEARTRERLL
jgi:hypothetical protein